MIKISKKLWCVKGVDREDNLSYMCPYDESKEGEPLANVAKMQATGRQWARVGERFSYKKNEKGVYIRDEKGNLTVESRIPAREGEEVIANNSPLEGFYVGSSVARWSTSNKLFRVKDPRGFTVEIPTDNLATLLHHTTVVKGFVQEACVWGREGNNHILLPVNSEPYLETLDQMDTLANKLISVKDLKVGDWVKFFEDDTEYYYAGKLKGTWKIRGYSWPSYWDHDKTIRYSGWVEVQDEKWTDVFLRKYRWQSDESKYGVEHPSKPKIVEIIKHEPLTIDTKLVGWYCPQRVSNKTNWSDHWQSFESELVSIEEKKK